MSVRECVFDRQGYRFFWLTQASAATFTNVALYCVATSEYGHQRSERPLFWGICEHFRQCGGKMSHSGGRCVVGTSFSEFYCAGESDQRLYRSSSTIGYTFFAFGLTFSIDVWCKHNALDATTSVFVCWCTGKEGILRCHPDLAGRDLQRGTLTQESRVEQAAAGLDALGSEEASCMERLNDEYKQRFGFPFVICARMNDKATILDQMTERCQNEPALETVRGIEEVKKICSLRLHSIILVDTPRL